LLTCICREDAFEAYLQKPCSYDLIVHDTGQGPSTNPKHTLFADKLKKDQQKKEKKETEKQNSTKRSKK